METLHALQFISLALLGSLWMSGASLQDLELGSESSVSFESLHIAHSLQSCEPCASRDVSMLDKASLHLLQKLHPMRKVHG